MSTNDLTISADGAGAWPDLLRPGVQLARWQRLALLPPPRPGAPPDVAVVGVTLDGETVFLSTPWPQLARAVQALAPHAAPQEGAP